ncbi:MAG: (2Fe-2S) ferredoxin domain-containing protein [Fervidobacterium sp.]
MNNYNTHGKYLISICFGSSCHLKGSYLLKEKIEGLIQESSLTNIVKLNGSLCLGKCSTGINVFVEGNLMSHIKPENVDAVFSKVLEIIEKDKKIMITVS